MALASGASSPTGVSSKMSGRGGINRNVLALATSVSPGVCDVTPCMKDW